MAPNGSEQAAESRIVQFEDDARCDTDTRLAGRDESGQTVVAAGALPGERLEVAIEHTSRKKKSFGNAGAVLAASAHRVSVPCPHFLRCGGCDLLHADLKYQHAFKHRLVADALAVPPEQVQPVVPSPQPLGYRALAKLVVGPDGRLGSYRPRSHDVVDMSGCSVHAPVVERVVEAVREYLQSHQVDLRYLVVRASVAMQTTVTTLVARDADALGVKMLGAWLARHPEVSRVSVNVNDSDGDAILSADSEQVLYRAQEPAETIGGVQQAVTAAGFSQVNPGAAAKLYDVTSAALKPAGKTILDLYAGSAGIALSLVRDGAAHVTAVETNSEACRAARHSCAMAGLEERLEVREDAVEHALFSVPPVDAVVLNPPRKGASLDALELLSALAPFDFVYVSCNPTSLARDIERLRRLGTVRLEAVIPVDLFPQTRHIETVYSGHFST